MNEVCTEVWIPAVKIIFIQFTVQSYRQFGLLSFTVDSSRAIWSCRDYLGIQCKIIMHFIKRIITSDTFLWTFVYSKFIVSDDCHKDITWGEGNREDYSTELFC